jgi:hypothetical protein
VKTGQVLLRELRGILDEQVENKWPDPVLIGYLSDGVQQVSMKLKDSNQRWQVRVLNTASAPLSIYGVTYTPATALAAIAGQSLVVLPRDCVEIYHVYPETQANRDLGYEFVPMVQPPQNLEHRVLTPGIESTRHYSYSFQGDSLRILPSLYRAMSLEIHYNFAPPEVTLFVNVDLPEWTYECVLLYAKYKAYQTISMPTTGQIYTAWDAAIKRALSYSTPRSSQAPVVVRGMWDEEW